MDESIEDLETKRDEFQKTANKLKKERDQLHLKSKKLADERDELNSTIREIRNKIYDHKKSRDELNERVKHAKEQRNKLNKAHGEIKKKIEELEKEHATAAGTNLNDLRKQLRTLENEQMTQPMSTQKEKKLIEVISGVHTKIKSQEEVLNKDPKLKKAIEEEKIVRQEAEKQHDLVEKLATRAQEEHENMINLIKQSDNMIRKVNETQDMIITTKIQADTIHRQFIEYVDKIHDLERKISAVHDKKFKSKRNLEVSAAFKEANEIFEKFKRGEKLSTEDLMALQKAGLI